MATIERLQGDIKHQIDKVIRSGAGERLSWLDRLFLGEGCNLNVSPEAFWQWAVTLNEREQRGDRDFMCLPSLGTGPENYRPGIRLSQRSSSLLLVSTQLDIPKRLIYGAGFNRSGAWYSYEETPTGLAYHEGLPDKSHLGANLELVRSLLR